MNVMQEKLAFLLDKYSVEAKATLLNWDVVAIDGTETPLLSHRLERRFIELKNMVLNNTLSGVSVMRVARIIHKGADINVALYREFDLCQWILGEIICQVTAFQNGNVLNVIATTKSGIVCTIEISATLADDMEPIDKHEIIAEHGIGCDVVVDAQLKQDSVYVFGDTKQKFTDVDFELYGLSIEDIAIVRSAFSLAQKKNGAEHIEADCYLNKLVAAAEKSAERCERVVL